MPTTAKAILTKMPMPKGQKPRWRKKYRGGIHYFRGSYAEALLQWEAKKLEIDHRLNKTWEGVREQLVKIGKGVYCDAIERYIEENSDCSLVQKTDWSDLIGFIANRPDMTPDELAVDFADDVECHEEFVVAPKFYNTPAKTPANPADVPIGKAIDEWLTGKNSQVVMGKVKAATVSSCTNNINQFRQWVGEEKPLSVITEQLLFDFYNHLAEEISGGRMKMGYAHQILLYTKSFVKRQWELRRIDLPRNIGTRDLTIPVPDQSITVLTVDEIKAFYNRGTSLLKTCVLLSLNCGFNQVDIATLRHTEVDWENGTITKKRVKTGGYNNVPTITWKLWPTTFAQLKKHRSKHPDLVLLGRKDRQLITGGGLERQDVIGKMWRYVRKKLGRGELAYKLLRKTASTTLASHAVYGRYAQYFLAHSPSTVADKHYVQPSQSQFDEAIKWLGDQFGL
jgi:hypothetical protein